MRLMPLWVLLWRCIGFLVLDSANRSIKEALAIEFERQGIPFEKEKAIIVKYKDIDLHNTFRADFVCYHDIIVELKALESTTPEHRSQVINYLKATGFKLGLLINFGEKQLYRRRIINTSIFQ